MTNRHRGEVALKLVNGALPMRLTLNTLAELEAAFAVDSLPALGERFTSGRLSARDVVRILAAGLRGAGSDLGEDEVSALPFEGGLAGAIAAAIELLDATFAPAEPSARPPQPAAAT